MITPRRHLLALLLLVASAFSFSQETLDPVQVLRDGAPDDDITGLDPFYLLGTSGQPMARAIYEGLVRLPFGVVNLEGIEPALAERWTVSEDGLTYTFFLRHGVQFHHGYGEFTAEDVEFSIRRHRDEGGRFQSDYANVTEIEVVDPYTIVFRLSEPDAFFLFAVSNYGGGMVLSRRAFEEKGAEAFRSSPVGTGPFEFTEWISQEKVVLSRNESYWRGRPILDSIEFLFMPDVNVRTLALVRGDLDTSLNGQRQDEWVNQMREAGVVVDTLGFDTPMMLHFNMTIPPLDDLRVRQAMAYAIDLNDFVAYGGETVTRQMLSPLPPTMFAAVEDGLERYDVDLERARQLLAEAGYPNGFHLGRVYSSPRELYLDPLEIVQGNLARVGITFDIEVVAHLEFHERIRQNLNPIVTYPGPRATPAMVFGEYLHGRAAIGSETAITNFSHYGTLDATGDGVVDGIDDLVDRARVSLDIDEMRELYRQAQVRVMEDLPVYPLSVSAAVQVRQPWVELGHAPYEPAYINGYVYTEQTRILLRER